MCVGRSPGKRGTCRDAHFMLSHVGMKPIRARKKSGGGERDYEKVTMRDNKGEWGIGKGLNGTHCSQRGRRRTGGGVNEGGWGVKEWLRKGRRNEEEVSDQTNEQVAQGQYVVSDTRCPALSDCELE